jgi:single-stranded-DNA-specific exonuclease
VIGLIASRLKERFNTPTFAIAFNDEIGVGSGRSLSGADMGAAVRRAVDLGLAVKGGGHAMAAGVTLARDRLDDFRAFLNEALEAAVEAARLDDALILDATVAGRGVCLDLLRRVEQAGPFGQGNPEPLFALPEQQVTYAQIVGADHVRARLRSRDGATVDAIAFRAMHSPLGEALLKGDGALHVAAKLSGNFFRGVERVETRIIDVARVQ